MSQYFKHAMILSIFAREAVTKLDKFPPAIGPNTSKKLTLPAPVHAIRDKV